MTLQEMIKDLDNLSSDEQVSLFNILEDKLKKEVVNQQQTTANNGDDLKANLNHKKKDFWEALQEFRNRVDLESFDDDTFDNLRDKSPGREIIL
ncbi:hypothetical protein [Geminocystis herdmanii]|uniref:hypothetical protein n=1 Tax=Geminocystis herdmanii TaxID=669359 RepID=UPI000347BAC8|nr:hypothetical protein [Geminocystis herdmanii]